MPLPVSIVSIASFSPLGANPQEVKDSYFANGSCIKKHIIGGREIAVAALNPKQMAITTALQESHQHYRHLDKSVLYAILASRAAVKAAGWSADDTFGINIGSSRGATGLFEEYHAQFLSSGKTGIQASPATTLGNISSWVAQDLKSAGPEISHSITCSTSLHALMNGVAWLRAGMADKFLVGGSEAPITPFTLAQMQSMKIYSQLADNYPCRSLDPDKQQNTMVLGEGAASACLVAGNHPNALAMIEGIGYATETLQHSVSISADAACLQRAMAMALGTTPRNEVDVVVMHTPGTIKGDSSEYKAVQKVFGERLPLLTTNKWKVGHTFGTSGLLSVELALLMLELNTYIGVPFLKEQPDKRRKIKKVLVNAVGFGGNAVSVLIGI